MIQIPRPFARIPALWLMFGAVGCGGSGGPAGPRVDPGFMVGEWIAESMVVTSKLNPDVAPDITEQGATFTLSVQPSGRYTAILSGYGQSSSESGMLTIEGSEVVFMRQLPSPEDSRATWEQVGSSVILTGETQFDFNLDGTTEAATLRSVFVPR